MPSGFNKRHIRIDAFGKAMPYQRPKRKITPRTAERETERHAEALKRDLAAAWAAADVAISARPDDFEGQAGRYIDFETLADFPLPNLNWTSQGIRLARADRAPDGTAQGTIYVPDAAFGFLDEKIEAYRTRRGERGRPSNEDRFAAIEHFRAARLQSLWVDSRPLPDEGELSWWEVWCWPDRTANFEARAGAAGVLLGEGRLGFVERTVIFAYCDRKLMAALVASCDAVAELRLGHDDAAFFTSGEGREDQDGWVASAVDRIAGGPNRDGVAVCLLDTGVNRAHPLLAPVFAAEDLHAVNPAWGVDDHHGHGTELSGLAIYGDLTTLMSSVTALRVNFSGEVVKLLPPQGFPDTEPQSYGLVTQQAIARPEIARADRKRVFCLAVTQGDVFGPKATSWSAALDTSTFGGEDLADLKQRLICVSAGNLPDGLKKDDLEDWDSFEIEDPAHAWNVLTVGGYTQKGPITDKGFEHWPCAAELGALSPYSRVSAAWARGVSPIKPELVLEAGNKGIDSADSSMVSGIDSLSLLTTSHQPLEMPLTLSWATSAATAQLAGMAGELLADEPARWPETIRALLAHSARWTAPMEKLLLGTNQKSERLPMLRRFGYGVPDLARALRSASNSLALVAEREIQPFIRQKGLPTRLNEAHFYALPWPRSELLALGEHEVRLRVALSYFVEPNPSADAPLSPSRYRSAGLRFDLRRRGERQERFERRINALATTADTASDVDADDLLIEASDPGRILGERSISAGSLHVDEWRCRAADIADRDALAVFPVGGWWKTSRDKSRNNGKVRYALVVTIDAGDVENDLWIETAVAAGIAVPTHVDIDVET